MIGWRGRSARLGRLGALGFSCGAALALLLATTAPTRAEVGQKENLPGGIDRYAVIFGNNLGALDEVRLRFAETDASKLHAALKDIGGFPVENMVLLRGENTAAVRSAIIATNDRVRTSVTAGRQAVLLIYYSGHADAEALHLGGEDFGLRELEQLARGSAANLRLLIVDACRSGALTQTKGGVAAVPFPIQVEQRLAGEGAIFLTSSTSTEASQESDALSGSFFTHYLVSGLLGAADQNNDGHVSLEEAYRFTYDSTVRASSRTLAGLQHPTFRFELHGHGGFVLTSPFKSAARAQVAFPEGITFLVAEGDEHGPVVAEVGAGDRTRRLSLKPGKYFVRGRTRNYLLEGALALESGGSTTVAEKDLRRAEYARLVRKGGGDGTAASAEIGYQMATPLWEGSSLCHGAFAGPSLAFMNFSLGARASFCRSRELVTANLFEPFRTTLDQYEIGARAMVEWDLELTTVALGLGTGFVLLHQTFDTNGRAPDRLTAAGTVAATGRVTVPLGSGRPFLLFELSLDTFFSRKSRPDGQQSLGTTIAGRGFAGVGFHL